MNEQKQDGMTVTVAVRPALDNSVVALGDEIIRLGIYAQQLVVEDNASLERATNDLSLMSNLKKGMEEKRREYVGPLQGHIKDVNDAFKKLSEPLAAADQAVRGKVGAYLKQLEDKRKKQEEINAMRLGAAEKEMELKGELTQPVELVEETVVPSQVRTDVGTVGTAKTRKWEVVDFAAVPDEYKMPDASKIGRVVRAGIDSIPGIRIWLDESMRVTPKR